MTDPTGSTPTPPSSTPRRLNVSAPVSPKPRFLTPAMQQQIAEEQAIAAEEQSGLPAEAAVAAGIPEPTPVIPDPVVEVPQQMEPVPAPTPVQDMTAAEEQAGLPSEEAVIAEQNAPLEQEPALTPETPVAETAQAPSAGNGLIDPKIAETLSKIREAQEELERAQQQALAMMAASINPAAAQPPANIPIPEPPPVAEIPKQPVLATPKLNTPGTMAAPAAQSAPLAAAPVLRAAIPVTATAPQASAFAAPQAAMAAPAAEAQAAPPTGMGIPSPAAKYMPKPPEPFLKSKSFKIYAIVFGVLIIAIGVLAWSKHLEQVEKEKIVMQITELRKLGAQLGEKAKELGQKSTPKLNYQFKYSPSEYGITVTPDKDKAEILIDAVRDHKQRFEWETELHVLTVMAAQDMTIAENFFNDIKESIKNYGDDKLTQMAILVSSQKNPELQTRLLKLADEIGKKDIKKKAAIMSQAFYGMTPADLPGLVKQFTDSKTPDSMKTPLSTAIDYIMLRSATDADRQTVAKELLTSLGNIDSKRKMEYYVLLAKTGAPQALNKFKGMITGGEPESSQALKALGDWPNDTINPVLLEIINSGQITDPRKFANVRSLGLMQLGYDRKRTDEEGLAMYKPYVDAAEQEQDEAKKKDAKMLVIYSLRNLPLYGYVKQMLEAYSKDSNADVAMGAQAAISKITDREKAKNEPVKTRAEKEAEILKMLEGTTSTN